MGKILLGIRVVDLNYSKISWWGEILRDVLIRILSGSVLGSGYFGVAWGPQKQGWHDKIASTYVIKV